MTTIILLVIALPIIIPLYMFGSKPTQQRIEGIYDTGSSKVLDGLEERIKGA